MPKIISKLNFLKNYLNKNLKVNKTNMNSN